MARPYAGDMPGRAAIPGGVLVDAAPEAIRRWSWWVNGWSYAGLVLFWVGVGVKWYLARPAGWVEATLYLVALGVRPSDWIHPSGAFHRRCSLAEER